MPVCRVLCAAGIEVLEQERRFMKQARKEVETQAQRMLEQGMSSQVRVGSRTCCCLLQTSEPWAGFSKLAAPLGFAIMLHEHAGVT